MSLQDHIRAGALGGTGCAVMIALFEVALLPQADRTPRLVLAIGGILCASFLLTGALSGLSLGLFHKAGMGVARLGGSRREASITAALVAAAGSPAIFLFVQQLASGRKAAQVIGSLPIRLGLTGAGVLLLFLCCLGGLAGGRLLCRSRLLLRLSSGFALLVVTAALFLSDAFLFRRLYQFIHQLLLLSYFTTGTLGVLCLGLAWRRRGDDPPRTRRWAPRAGLWAATAAVLVWGMVTRQHLGENQRLRFSAVELTAAATQILGFLPLSRRAETPLFLGSAGKRALRAKSVYRVEDANVVLVSIDALRADHLGTYGYSRSTSPNIDALARQAVRFESTYCQAPLTCYSIPSLLTGDYLKSTLPLIPKAPPTLARILDARGYTTAAFYNASIFFCDDKRATSYGDNHFGFDFAYTKLDDAGALTDEVLAYLRRFRDEGKRKLFLWIHFFDVHEPYRRHAELDFGERDVDRYDGEIKYVDSAVGRLIAAMDQLEGPTIFVLTSDHGEEFKEHGGNYHGSSLYEEQIRVPLIIGVPGLKHRVVRSPAQLVDVVPTLLSLLGIRTPESVRGQSLVPELLGKGDPDRAAFSEVHTKKMVRFRHWKLIHDFRRSTFELYDLLTDPSERANLIGRRPRETIQLKGLLHSWFDRLLAVGRSREERPEGIDLGRIGDRRSVPRLARLVNDPGALSRWRQEAARLLGQMQDRRAADELWTAAADDDPLVAAEAAIALGEMKDRRAHHVLLYTLESSSDEVRMRAAIAFARVDSPESTPALIEAMYSNNWEVQNRAAHYLGFVGDHRAITPLLLLSRHLHLRSRIALSLGRIGSRNKDRRITRFLLKLVEEDTHADVRQRALAGLGFLRDRRAVRPLSHHLAGEADLTWLPEALTRMGGLGGYWVPGLDFSPARRGLAHGWGKCTQGRSTSVDRYLGRSWCVAASARAAVKVNLKRPPFHAVLMLRVKPLQKGLKDPRLSLMINGRPLPPLPLAKGWNRLRVKTRSSYWQPGINEVRLHLQGMAGRPGADGAFAVDYLLLADPAASRKRKKSSRQ